MEGKDKQRTDAVSLGNANLLEALGDRHLFDALLVVFEGVHRVLGEHGFDMGWVDEGFAGYGGERHCCCGCGVWTENKLLPVEMSLDRD